MGESDPDHWKESEVNESALSRIMTRFGTRFAALNSESACGERLVPLSGVVEVLLNSLLSGLLCQKCIDLLF